MFEEFKRLKVIIDNPDEYTLASMVFGDKIDPKFL